VHCRREHKKSGDWCIICCSKTSISDNRLYRICEKQS
jgi:hypothetical protein